MHIRDVAITIGGLTIRMGDLKGFRNSCVVLANGMEIKASSFEIDILKRKFAEKGKNK